MHTCLITAPTITEYRSRAELASDAVQAAALHPQLGILSVAAVLESCGDWPCLVDVNSAWLRYAEQTMDPAANDAPRRDFADYVAALAVRSNADVYGLGSICSTYPLSIRIADAIKRLQPWATILLGGPQASVVDVATMTAFPFVDFILRGEVEATLPSLMHELQHEVELSRVGGLTYRVGGEIRRNANAAVIEDLDTVASPAYHLSTYLERSQAASVELGRGCPFSCTFCSTNDFFRRKFRLRSPERVLEDMRAIAAEHGIRHFDLVHDMFTVDRKRVVAFCEAMLASGESFTWDCSARTDSVDEALLELMVRSGCRSVFFGIETGSRRMQRIIDKDLDPDWAEEVLDIAERLGMRSTAALITGFPEELREDLRDTLRVFLHSARCSRSLPQLNLLAPLAGTPIHARHRDSLVLDEVYSDMSYQGLSQDPLDLELIRRFPEIFPNFYLIATPGLDREEIVDLKEFLTAAMTRFRWLLCAIARATDLLDFHTEWRRWRAGLRPELAGSELRRYYLSRRFHGDLVRFLEEHEVGAEPSVETLARVERALYLAEGGRVTLPARLGPRSPGSGQLAWNSTPVTVGTTQTVELGYRLDDVVAALGACVQPTPVEPVFYATRLDRRGGLEVLEVSAWMAATLRACDGQRTVAAILDELVSTLPTMDEEGRRYVVGSMLLGAEEAGFVALQPVRT